MQRKRFDTRFEVVLPAKVGDCLEAMAEREMTSKSEYARRAIIKSLKRDDQIRRQLETA